MHITFSEDEVRQIVSDHVLSQLPPGFLVEHVKMIAHNDWEADYDKVIVTVAIDPNDPPPEDA